MTRRERQYRQRVAAGRAGPGPGRHFGALSPSSEAIGLKPDVDARLSEAGRGALSGAASSMRPPSDFAAASALRPDRHPRARAARRRRPARQRPERAAEHFAAFVAARRPVAAACSTSSGSPADARRQPVEAAEALTPRRRPRRPAGRGALPARASASASCSGRATRSARSNARSRSPPPAAGARAARRALRRMRQRAGRIRQLEALLAPTRAPAGRSRSRSPTPTPARARGRSGCSAHAAERYPGSRRDLRRAGPAVARRARAAAIRRARQGARGAAARGIDGADQRGAHAPRPGAPDRRRCRARRAHAAAGDREAAGRPRDVSASRGCRRTAGPHAEAARARCSTTTRCSPRDRSARETSPAGSPTSPCASVTQPAAVTGHAERGRPAPRSDIRAHGRQTSRAPTRLAIGT